jgi:hypothetical protein
VFSVMMNLACLNYREIPDNCTIRCLIEGDLVVGDFFYFS